MSVRSRIVWTLFGVAALSAGVANAKTAVASEADHAVVISRTVRYTDLDLSQPRDAATLYERLKMASKQVCDTGYSTQDLRMKALEMKCSQDALTNAVAKVNSPLVAALHDSSYRTRLASAKSSTGRS